MRLLTPETNLLAKLTSLNTLCSALDVKKGHLLYICYERPDERKYSSFEIPKRRGGKRKIDTPLKGLRLIQERLAELLEDNIQFKSCVKGFVKDEGIFKNALLHKKSHWILNVDIQDFFGSINFGRVRAAFIAKPFQLPPDVATVIAQICTFKNALPQGAPTSPIISNIIASTLDNKIIKHAKKHRLIYSRYADDITLSAKRHFPKEIAYIRDGKTLIGEDLQDLFSRAKFTINPNKSRLQSRYSRQEVTGLIVNKKINIPVEYKNKLRSAISQWLIDPSEAERRYYYEILGKDPKNFKISMAGEQLKRNIYGRLSFMAMIKGKDDPTYLNLLLKMAEGDASPPAFVRAIKREHKMYDVFLCHASEDKEAIVKPLCEELKSLGINVFIDEEEIAWGESLVDVINKALHKSKYVIAVMTENSVEKKWPQKEIHAVLSNEISSGKNKLLPLIHGDPEDILGEHFLMSDKLFKIWKDNPSEIAKSVFDLLKKTK